MHVVILGAGSFGSYLAETLSQKGYSITLIDHDPKALERVGRSADIATRLGSGTDYKILEELLETNPDFFIAMSAADETNLVACRIAKKLGYPKTAARIRQNFLLSSEEWDIGALFAVDHVIGTEWIIAKDIFKLIIHSGTLALESFAKGHVQMRTVIIPEDFKEAGKSLESLLLSDNLLVGLIRRKIGESSPKIIFPKGQDHLLPGDEATLIGIPSEIQALSQRFEIKKKKVQSAVLIGGSGVAVNLCKLLIAQNISVKIVEQNEERCRELASLFPDVTILNHDGTDFSFLEEERVSAADVVVSCTSSHEKNILAAALAKQVGCQEVVALICDESCLPLLKQLGINHTLSERASVAARVQGLLYDKSVVSIASLHENQAKIMEVKISSDSTLTKTPISALKGSLPPNFLIALLETESGVTIPKGNNVLSAGDTAIVICSPESAKEMERLM